MNIFGKIAIGVLTLFIVFGAIGCSYFVSTKNTCVSFEQRVQAQYTKNQNVYDSFWKTVKEVAQVPDKYAKDTKSLYESVLKGRYGEKGSQAMFQFLKESNPTLDASLYAKIQEAMEAGRRDFKNNQTVLIDIKQEYQIYIGSFPRSIVVSILGYPSINLKDFDIVTSDQTEKAFKDKKADEIKI